MSNENTYASSDVVKNYSKSTYLHDPEKTVLRMLRPKLKSMNMLDIGTGAGRTSCHFMHLVKGYTGIDYSKEMVNACKKRFRNPKGKINFEVCDARSMHIFKDNRFDFILVSSNALDYISHEDRLKALKEIRRVGKPGGFFLFSSHNLQSIGRLLEVPLTFNPVNMFRNIVTYALLKILNTDFKKLKKEKYTIMNDGAHQFRLSTYYIRPAEQIKQLENEGFSVISVYSSENGAKIKKSDINATKEGLYHGLYYFCRM